MFATSKPPFEPSEEATKKYLGPSGEEEWFECLVCKPLGVGSLV